MLKKASAYFSIVAAAAVICCTGGSGDSTSSSSSSSSGSSGASSSGSSGASSSGSSGASSSGSSGASSTSGDPCAGLGCAGPQGNILLSVVDAQGKGVVAPTFTIDGAAAHGNCEVTTDGGGTIFETPDAGAPCPGEYQFYVYTFGTLKVVVSAPGFMPSTVNVKLERPGGCCGGDVTVHSTVTLSP